MKAVYTFIALTGLFAAIVFAAGAATRATETKTATASKPETIVLEKKNTVILRLPFTEDSVKDVQIELLAKSRNLPKHDPIYLYLDTPGGSIGAGEQLITTVKGLPNEVKTITSFSASMGYQTVQNLGERLVLPNGVLMSHRAKMGLEGQVPGEFNVRAKFYMDDIENLDKIASSRVGLSTSDYQKLIHDEYWVEGQAAVNAKHADRVVLVNCGSDLQGTYSQKIMTFFGPVMVEWSECPLISAPVGVTFGGNYSDSNFGNSDNAEFNKFKAAMYETIYNKRNFVGNASLQQTYLQYVK